MLNKTNWFPKKRVKWFAKWLISKTSFVLLLLKDYFEEYKSFFHPAQVMCLENIKRILTEQTEWFTNRRHTHQISATNKVTDRAKHKAKGHTRQVWQTSQNTGFSQTEAEHLRESKLITKLVWYKRFMILNYYYCWLKKKHVFTRTSLMNLGAAVIKKYSPYILPKCNNNSDQKAGEIMSRRTGGDTFFLDTESPIACSMCSISSQLMRGWSAGVSEMT